MSESDEKKPRSRIRGDLREMVIVVLSILIAFGLDAWWDGVGERRAERVVLSNLQSEFQETRVQLVERIAMHRRAEFAARGFTAFLEDNAGSATVSVPDSLVSLLFITPSFDPQTGSLDGLLASGSLGMIDDPRLRQALGAWPGLLSDAAEDEEHILDLKRSELVGTVGQYAPITRAIENAWVWLVGDDVPASFLEGTVEVPNSPRLLNAAFRRATYSMWAADEMGEVLVHLDRILELLDEAL